MLVVPGQLEVLVLTKEACAGHVEDQDEDVQTSRHWPASGARPSTSARMPTEPPWGQTRDGIVYLPRGAALAGDRVEGSSADQALQLALAPLLERES